MVPYRPTAIAAYQSVNAPAERGPVKVSARTSRPDSTLEDGRLSAVGPQGTLPFI